ncbi:hypothetical protein CTAYLR_004913 [Chrysophaeum taylorii]|uniref:Uncharacterized protein n=1 Tax=Chrysophaeum taylorii TaxID=2483200 RepID=A0AAD7UQV4_9STRA|nr:hypothetical protein CTAYLR_004913 [Chrysophaeum taylorii]
MLLEVRRSSSLLLGLLFLVLPTDAQARRGPPRGPIKGDQSHFFGKEGDYQSRGGSSMVPVPTILIAVVVAVVLVGVKVYFKLPPVEKSEKNK